jgi:predicted nucleic acid-binding protein
MTPVVLDANLALALILPLPYSQQAAQQFERWKRARVPLQAPSLWTYEVVSGLRKVVFDRVISPEMAQEGLHSLWALNVVQISPDPALARSALLWAERLGRRVAYDAVYLALAERLESEFWTADGALARNLSQMGILWVRSVAEV